MDKKYLRDPDGGVNLAKKKAQLGVLEEVIPEKLQTTFPSETYSDKLEGLPAITFKSIWTYMVSCMDAVKQLSTAKPMVKGFNFYKSGHVASIKSYNKDSKTFIKSLVLPSMKKTTAYSCFIILTRQGFVYKASCGCPAGIDGRCNHVAATLFALESFCKGRSTQEVACTSKPCTWNVPRKRKLELTPVSKMKFRKHEYGTVKKERKQEIPDDRDVRTPQQQTTTNTKLYNILCKVETFQDKTGKLIGLSHVLTQKTTAQLKDAVQHDHCYCELPNESNNDHAESNPSSPQNVVPVKDPTSLISPIKKHPVSLQEIKSRCERIEQALKVTSEKVKQIELSTRNQSLDPE